MSAETKKFIKYGVIIAVIYLCVKDFSVIVSVFLTLLAAASPLFVGACVAYILNILMKRIEKVYFPQNKSKWVLKSKRTVSIFLSLALLVLLAALLMKLVIPELVSSFKLIGQEIPPAIEKLQITLVKALEDMPSVQQSIRDIKIDWPTVIKQVADYVIVGAGGVLSSVMAVAQSVFGTLTQVMIGFIFAIYILFNKEKLANQGNMILKAYAHKNFQDRIRHILKIANETFSNFIVGQCTDAVIIGTLCTIGMWICRFPYAPMTGAVVGVTALIPVVGAYIGAAIGAFMIFTVSPVQALLFLIFLVILQQLEGNLIYPKVVGSSIGLPGMWVLAAVTIGGSTFGILGMLIGVPFAATCYKLLREDVYKRANPGKNGKITKRAKEKREEKTEDKTE